MKFPIDFPIIKTERLHLIAFQNEDILDLYHFQSDKNNFPNADLKIFRSLYEAEERIKYWSSGFHKQVMIAWAIKYQEKTVGMIDIWNFEDDANRAEVSFYLYPEFRTRGFIKEALQAVVKYAVQELEIDDIRAFTRPENQAAKNTLNSAGFQYHGDIKDTWYDEYDPPEMSVYRIRARELS